MSFSKPRSKVPPLTRRELVKTQIAKSITDSVKRSTEASDIRSYEVFLSFRGLDTRASFTSHLHASLQNDGISVFMDDDSLQRGDHISTSLVKAIEDSRVSVIVFSTNYADSRWCLDELVKIMECRRTIGQVVLPVFYGVDPSEVRHQTGQFGQAFQTLLNRMNQEHSLSQKWRDALLEAAGLAGFVVLNSRNEREAINHIVEKITLLLDKTDLFVADNPVGVESRVQDTTQQLGIEQSNNVLLLGMWGMGGTGKTTIAKAIYNKIGRNFEEIGISVLVERSLVTVDDKNKLGMHDLLRDMGREIIREKSPKEPEERSRLWFHEDVLDVLSDRSGTKAVEGLALKLPIASSKCFSTKAFKKMKRLRLLQLVGIRLDGDFEYLSRNLRWLCWNGFPLTCIPSDFYQRNIVSMELENSNMRVVWKETQRMEMLKILNLSHSHHLMQTPDFSNLPNLEKLILVDCPMLSEVSNSIGELNKILSINLEDCINLCNLPRSIYKLTSLKTLILSGCLMIDTLEEDIEQMESLTTLIANNTGITRVPFSVVRSKSIGYISLCGYEGFSRDVFPSIIWSWMSPTNNFPSQFQTSTIMSSLVPLDVPHSSSQELSSISKYLPNLRSLWVECSSEDQLSLDTTIILEALCTTNSKELEPTTTTSQVSKISLKSLFIQLGVNCQVTNILKEKILQNTTVDESGGCVLLDDSYPDWLSFNCDGSSVIFEVPQVEGHNLKSLMCIAYSSTPDNITSDGLISVLVKNYTKATIQLYKRETLASFKDEEGERLVSSIEPGDRVEVVVVFESGFIVKKTTIYLIYD
ncbi:unnamed protein product [Vicia faba]|uniref:TIR domain-containing protein n=1 Tax=Vicia faba TaxID=3906 RepID=A0AAV0Z8R2_VICFA|nr:unnamed protein product [Vicia faba]